MAGRNPSGALTAGILFIVIGVVFLLENWYGAVSFWRLFARYWPLILIAIGMKKLYGYFTWEETPPPLPESDSQKE
jgi:uncharacterized integral membrane protein